MQVILFLWKCMKYIYEPSPKEILNLQATYSATGRYTTSSCFEKMRMLPAFGSRPLLNRNWAYENATCIRFMRFSSARDMKMLFAFGSCSDQHDQEPLRPVEICKVYTPSSRPNLHGIRPVSGLIPDKTVVNTATRPSHRSKD